MFGGTIIDAICDAQISIGGQMATDANTVALISNMQVELSQGWFGNSAVQTFDWMQNKDNFPDKQPLIDGNNQPVGNHYYTTAEIQAVLKHIANAEAGESDSTKLEQLEASRQLWSSLGSTSDNMKDLQKSPLDALAQAGSSNIQQDQSASSGSTQAGGQLADLDGIAANLITAITA